MSAIAAAICPPGRSGTGMPNVAAWNSTSELPWVSDDRSLVTLAKSLVGLGIADPEDWSRCDTDPNKYVLETTRRWVEKHGAHQIRRRFDLHLTLADTILAYPDRKAEEHNLFLIVDPDSADYIVLMPSYHISLVIGRHERVGPNLRLSGRGRTDHKRASRTLVL